MKNNKNKIELLSPAGNFHKLKIALAHGADAVYVGIPDFSLRVRINDFDLKGIKEATEYCHKKNKKIYITVNIFAHNKHIKKLPNYIKELKKIGVDALIVSDPGVICSIKEIWSEAEIHLSTQANATNWKTCKFWKNQGVKRIILGREVTLKEIKKIHKEIPELELEYFVHGAMCMAYSGRCFLSKEFLNRSGNLGDCVQPCRWEWQVKSEKLKIQSEKELLTKAKGHNEEFELVHEEHGAYLLNAKDLCLIEHLRELQEAGISSFKIEGRAKSVYYQAVIASIYSYVIFNLGSITQKEINFFKNELETKLVHRGYTKGFLFGEKAEQNITNSHEKCEWEFCGEVQIITNDELLITNNDKLVPVKVHNSLKKGDMIEIVRPGYDIMEMRVGKMYDIDDKTELEEAHGGQERMVLLEVSGDVPEYSVIRRKI